MATKTYREHGRFDLGQVSFGMQKTIKARLRKAAKANRINMSIYVEQAVLEKLEREAK